MGFRITSGAFVDSVGDKIHDIQVDVHTDNKRHPTQHFQTPHYYGSKRYGL